MSRLSDELGYPMSAAEMERRLTELLGNALHHVAVAASDDRLLGWVHVEHRFSLEGGERAELMGLVIDSGTRRQGIGSELVAAAERWALERGLPSLTVRSNVLREESHPFYESLGYTRIKSQHVYGKAVDGTNGKTRR